MRLSQLLSGLGSQPLAVMCAQLGGGGGRHQMEFTGKEREQLFGCKKKRIENGPANSPLCVYNEEMNRKAPKIPAPSHTHTPPLIIKEPLFIVGRCVLKLQSLGARRKYRLAPAGHR